MVEAAGGGERNGSSPTPVSFRRRIEDPRLRELYGLWLNWRGAGRFMLRRDLDPTPMPRLLKHLILADVANGGRSIRYRLVGTDIVAAHGLDYTGLRIEELTGGATLAFTRELYGIVVSQAVPVYSMGHFRWTDKEYRWTKRLHLPLSLSGDAVDQVLAGQIFEPERTDGEERLDPALPEELAFDRLAAGPS
jgi:hypothetical protein